MSSRRQKGPLTTEEAFSQNDSRGVSATPAKADHTHGTPTNPVDAITAATKEVPGFLPKLSGRRYDYLNGLGEWVEAAMIGNVETGVSVAAGSAVLATPVMKGKSFFISVSKGSAGYVAARGNILYNSVGGVVTASTTVPPTVNAGIISGGTTDLTVKQYSAVLSDEVGGFWTKVTYDGPVEWQVIS
jgi:hypothetical protein